MTVDDYLALQEDRDRLAAALAEARGEIEKLKIDLLAEQHNAEDGADVIRQLRAEMRKRLSPCRHAKLMAEASDPALREEVQRLRAFIDDLTMAQYHACVTGDCPHEHIKDCAEAMTAELRRIGESAEAALAGVARPKNDEADELTRLRAQEAALGAWRARAAASRRDWSPEQVEDMLNAIGAGKGPGEG